MFFDWECCDDWWQWWAFWVDLSRVIEEKHNFLMGKTHYKYYKWPFSLAFWTFLVGGLEHYFLCFPNSWDDDPNCFCWWFRRRVGSGSHLKGELQTLLMVFCSKYRKIIRRKSIDLIWEILGWIFGEESKNCFFSPSLMGFFSVEWRDGWNFWSDFVVGSNPPIPAVGLMKPGLQ